jgi:hypothetical protein
MSNPKTPTQPLPPGLTEEDLQNRMSILNEAAWLDMHKDTRGLTQEERAVIAKADAIDRYLDPNMYLKMKKLKMWAMLPTHLMLNTPFDDTPYEDIETLYNMNK